MNRLIFRDFCSHFTLLMISLFLSTLISTEILAADISPSFTYQGMLSEDGHPLSGSRNMSFRVHSDNSCTTTVGNAIIRNGVVIDNGVFSVELTMPLPPEDMFPGQGRWLEVQVEGIPIACQELQAVPYAFTIRPGAVIEGSKPTRWALSAINTSTSGTNYGIRAETKSADGAGVYAQGVNDNADLILGANENSTLGDNGVITSDPAYTGSDIYIRSNDLVQIQLDDDNNTTNSSFSIVDGNGAVLFRISENGDMTIYGKGLSRPNYDSGWQDIVTGSEITIWHYVGGNAEDYLVDLTCWSGSDGINNWGVGADQADYGNYGVYYHTLNTVNVRVTRLGDDSSCPQVRLRIWEY